MRHKLTKEELSSYELNLLQADPAGYDYRCRVCLHLFKEEDLIDGCCPVCGVWEFLTTNLGEYGKCA